MKKSVEEKVKELLGKMTLKEKISQMGANIIERPENLFVREKFSGKKLKPFFENLGTGGFYHTGRVKEVNVDVMNAVQKYFVEKTRLGIPVLMSGEGLHGHVSHGATIFPQAIGLASTWNTALIEEVAKATAKEARAFGIHQLLCPDLDLAREPRWGRVQETYGEDPYLAGRMGVAYIRGLQGYGDFIDENHVVATPKHFTAHGMPESGINLAPVHGGERELRELYLPAFKSAVTEAKALSIMPCYSEYDGIPCSGSKKLLTKILREEWGFSGYVYSDWGAIEMLHTFHRTAQTMAEAGKQSLEAGMDFDLGGPGPEAFGKNLLGLAEKGIVSEKDIDLAVSRILKIKFLIGLFEKPYVSRKRALRIRDCRQHRTLALQAARESVVLLKNEKNLLPISKKLSTIAVIGPNADRAQLGNYSGFNDNLVTVLEGIKRKVSKNTRALYAEGCGIYELPQEKIADAVSIAREADVAIVVIGESNEVCNEGVDQTDLNLPGIQQKLVEAVHGTGVPVAVVLMNGRPLSTEWIADNVPAILEVWYPGEEGGNAVADVIFGDYNPSGKLAVTIPRSTGHIPVFYNHKPSGRGFYHKPGSPGNPGRDYAFSSPSPLFEFGHGLSYTTFKYGNLKIIPKKISPAGKTEISVEVKNTGRRKGAEVAQLYVRDVFGSTTTPVKSLKRFEKIILKPGQKKTVRFVLYPEDIALFDEDMRFRVEPGKFEILIGGLKGTFKVT